MADGRPKHDRSSRIEDFQRAWAGTTAAGLAGDAPGRTSDEQIVLFCSVGLAGTEAFLLDPLLR